jgi:UTP--glucose-1-phosphate uridylyltransferase
MSDTNPKKVRKAVIAAAGFGTRFLPQTKAMPKEMLPLVDKPIIQYIVEELVEAGIEDIVIVTGYHKRSIEDHFDTISGDLRLNLEQGKKTDLLNETEAISELANFAYIRQKGVYGTGTPVLNAQPLIGNEPFIYTFADDLIMASPSSFRQMIDAYERTGSSILSCVSVRKDEEYDKYGIVAGEWAEDGLMKVSEIIEKPGKERAPSNLASVSGYILTPEIFPYLEAHKSLLQTGEEFFIPYAMQAMISDGHEMFACEIKNGKFCDTGNKLEYVKTVIDFALERPDMKDDILAHLRDKLK